MIGELVRLRYEILEQLHSSVVFDNYIARDRVRNADVCLRLVRQPFSQEADFVQALGHLVTDLAVLEHPNIARVYEIDEHDGRPFLVCELVRGATLAERIRRVAPLSPAVAVELTIGILEALEHADQQGITHGDLCSDHIITTLDWRVSVIDFGLWRCYGASATAGGVVLSRMAPYLAPEIIEGEMPSSQSDCYALGVIMFELLTGRAPFIGQTAAATLAKHSTQTAPSLRVLNPAVPKVLEEIVSKALAKERSHRYTSPSAMLSDLRQLLDALRFGRQITWPLSGESEPPADARIKTYAEKKKEKRLGETVHAATFSGKSSHAEQSKPAPRVTAAGKPPPDVPAWLSATFYVFLGIFVCGLAFFIYSNISVPKRVELPNMIGLSIVEARTAARELGITLVESGREMSDQYPQPETIIDMHPAPHTPVRQGAEIHIKLSAGSRMVEVPLLKGRTLTEARTVLEASGLKLDPTPRYESDRETPAGQIVKQRPLAHDRVERSTRITVTVSTGRNPVRDDRNPEDLLPNSYTLTFKVKDAPGEVAVRVEMTDGVDDGKVVFEESVNGGATITRTFNGHGKEATFRIYFDGYVDKTIVQKGNAR